MHCARELMLQRSCVASAHPFRHNASRFPSATVAALVLHAAAVASATSGSFSLLSYNIAGLPGLIDSATNTPLISSRLAPYTIVNVQKDSSDYAAFYANDPHSDRLATTGDRAFLMTLSNFKITDYGRYKWDDCSLNGGDCLKPMGFMFLRLRAPEGAYVDLYNLLMVAGSDDSARTTRRSNWAQLTAFVQKYSQGMPLVIIGNTNSLYTDDVDGTSARNTVSALGVTDAWVKVVRDGTAPPLGSATLSCPFPFPAGADQSAMVACETVEKVLVRPGSTMSAFEPTVFTNENNLFLNSSGYPLSEHYPLATTINWTLRDDLLMGDYVGGPHGTMFNDLTGGRMTSLTVRGADRLDGFSYVAGGTVVTHGGSGGSPVTLNVTEDPIVSLQLCTGIKDSTTRVFYLLATTATGKTVQGGTATKDCVTMSAPAGDWALAGFHGRSTDGIYRLGPVWSVVSRPSVPPSASNSDAPANNGVSTIAIAIPVAIAVAAALAIGLLLFFLCRRRRRTAHQDDFAIDQPQSLFRSNSYPLTAPTPLTLPPEENISQAPTSPTRPSKSAPFPAAYFAETSHPATSSYGSLSEYPSLDTEGEELVRAAQRAGIPTQALLHSLHQMVPSPDGRDGGINAPPEYTRAHNL
ncbi:Endonuclease/exonuclease/phosphatase [Auriculariales sp. MPI-PUGE-AT-0066]|nr:Endonuclease/exonuclease/phosphatase [Auriculariales sp. MPI-PUGE-AT-0066]